MWLKDKNMAVKTKIWIEDEAGQMVFGAGRFRILQAVEDHGSLLGAAKTLRMSYRAAWGKINATERRLGQPLLHRRVGGVSGGGSELTVLGKALVSRFQRLQNLTENTANVIYDDLFEDLPPGDAS